MCHKALWNLSYLSSPRVFNWSVCIYIYIYMLIWCFKRKSIIKLFPKCVILLANTLSRVQLSNCCFNISLRPTWKIWFMCVLIFIIRRSTFETWWCHQMEVFSALLALCEGNSPVTGEFPSQRPVTRSFGVSFDLRLNKRLNEQSTCRWFETPLPSLWRHSNVYWVTPPVLRFIVWQNY